MSRYVSLKKALLVLAVVLVAITALPGCKKIAEKVFSGFDLPLLGIPTAIPGIPITNYTYSTYRTWPFNLDSIVKAESGGAFAGKDITSVRLKQAAFHLQNADSLVSMADLQSVSIQLYSDTVRNTATLVSATVPDTAANVLHFDVSNSPEILPYLKGSSITYIVKTVTRNPIQHNVDAYADLIFTIK